MSRDRLNKSDMETRVQQLQGMMSLRFDLQCVPEGIPAGALEVYVRALFCDTFEVEQGRHYKGAVSVGFPESRVPEPGIQHAETWEPFHPENITEQVRWRDAGTALLQHVYDRRRGACKVRIFHQVFSELPDIFVEDRLDTSWVGLLGIHSLKLHWVRVPAVLRLNHDRVAA